MESTGRGLGRDMWADRNVLGTDKWDSVIINRGDKL